MIFNPLQASRNPATSLELNNKSKFSAFHLNYLKIPRNIRARMYFAGASQIDQYFDTKNVFNIPVIRKYIYKKFFVFLVH